MPVESKDMILVLGQELRQPRPGLVPSVGTHVRLRRILGKIGAHRYVSQQTDVFVELGVDDAKQTLALPFPRFLVLPIPVPSVPYAPRSALTIAATRGKNTNRLESTIGQGYKRTSEL